MMRKRTVLLAAMVIVGGILLASPSSASTLEPGSLHPDVTAGDNSTCLACHQQPGIAFVLPSGEAIGATIDADRWVASEHGQHDMACVQCHDDITGVPLSLIHISE